MGAPRLALWVAALGALSQVARVAHCDVAPAPLAPAPLAPGLQANASDGQSPPLKAMGGLEEEESDPGVVQLVLAAFLGALLLGGLVRVYRVLHGLDVLTTALRNVPEGMRAAECGGCRQMQYVRTHGRIFICFSCQCANRMPRETPRNESQLLVMPTGPLRCYEFRKGGDNFWQELKQEELPVPPPCEAGGAEGGTFEVRKVHYRGTFCSGCSKQACLRLEEFPAEQSAAYLPEAPVDEVRIKAEAEADAAARPVVLGRQAEPDDTASNGTKDEGGLSQCVVCLDKPGCMVLLPCAHGSVCEECATRIAQNRAMGGAHCPHCRANIETLVKLHEVAGDVARGVEVRIPMARAP